MLTGWWLVANAWPLDSAANSRLGGGGAELQSAIYRNLPQFYRNFILPFLLGFKNVVQLQQ